jgi:hypothetical protein
MKNAGRGRERGDAPKHTDRRYGQSEGGYEGIQEARAPGNEEKGRKSRGRSEEERR